MKCDNIKLCKINILVSTFRTFDKTCMSVAFIRPPIPKKKNIY